MKDLIRLYDHLRWADARIGNALRSSPDTHGKAGDLFSHILAAERVWLLRLQGRDSSIQAIWPELVDEEWSELMEGNWAGYADLLSGLTTEAADELVHYSNQTGRSYHTSRRDILLHVAMHGSYHRGQIALLVRQSGGEPVNTDFIAYLRENS